MKNHFCRTYVVSASIAGVMQITGTCAASAATSGAVKTSGSQKSEQIVVTARRQSEDLEQVPISVAKLSSTEIERSSIRTADDIQFHVPGLQVNPSQTLLSAEPSFTLRGLSTTVPGTGVADAAVSTYFADAPLLYTRNLGHGLYDLADIQILYGPQGTLFGKNSIGGAVLFSPIRPTSGLEGYIQGTVGDYALHEISGAISGPVTHALAVRLAAKIGRRNGYTENLANDRDFNDENYQSGRVSVLYRPIDEIENYTVIDIEDSHETLPAKFATQIGGPILSLYGAAAPLPFWDIAAGTSGSIEMRFKQAQQDATGKIYSPSTYAADVRAYTLVNTSTVRPANSFTVKNILSYQHSETVIFQNIDAGTGYDFISSNGDPDRATQVSNEFQLLGKVLDYQLDWIAGFFYSHQAGKSLNNTTIYKNYNTLPVLASIGIDVPFNQLLPYAQFHSIRATSTDDSLAVYAHGTYNLNHWLAGMKLNGGFRYTWDKRATSVSSTQSLADFIAFREVSSCAIGNAPECSVKLHRIFSSPSWDVGLDYEISNGLLAYITSRQSFKSGGFNSTSFIPGTLEYKSEHLNDIEIGLKGEVRLGSSRARATLALFRSDYHNPSVPLLANYSTSAGVSTSQVIESVPGAVLRGGEFQFLFKPYPQLSLSGSYALTLSRYKRGSTLITAFGPGGSTAQTQALSGLPVANASKHTIQIASTWQFQTDPAIGDLSLTANYSWRSAQLIPGQGALDASGKVILATTLPAFGVFDLRLDMTSVARRSCDVSLWIKNVTDQRYATTYQAFLNVLGYSLYTYGAPRTVGATLTFRL